jgi:uncharacterized protein (DUF2141 family)
MTMKVRFLPLLLVVSMTMILVGCKPIAYYLERVYKAHGTVTDAETGDPLEGVEVILGDYQYSVLSNGLGDYGIELAEGTWTLHFVKDGHVTVDKQVTVSASIPRVKVDAQLSRTGYQLSGTWASPSGVTVPNGVYGYLKLVASGGLSTAQALYWTRSSGFSGGSSSYSIAGIAAGTYTVWAFIDMNANAANDSTSMPDAADYFLQSGKQVNISGNQILNFDSSGWMTSNSQDAWVIGFWGSPTYAPYTAVIEINANGNVYVYDNYDGTGLLASGTWSPSPDGVLVTVLGEQNVVTKISDNEIAFGSHEPAYRKGSALVDSVFTRAEHVLSPGIMTEATAAHQDMQLYSFTALSAGNYGVSWESYGIGIAAYRSDQTTSIFIHEDVHEPLFETIALAAGEKIFITVDPAKGWGSFRVMVQ